MEKKDSFDKEAFKNKMAAKKAEFASKEHSYLDALKAKFGNKEDQVGWVSAIMHSEAALGDFDMDAFKNKMAAKKAEFASKEHSNLDALKAKFGSDEEQVGWVSAIMHSEAALGDNCYAGCPFTFNPVCASVKGGFKNFPNECFMKCEGGVYVSNGNCPKSEVAAEAS